MFLIVLLLGMLCIDCDTDWSAFHIGNTVLNGVIVIAMFELYEKYKDK